MQRVPDKFVSKFKDELSVAVALTVPDGHVWRVGLRKADNNKIWFQDGWQEFVDRYSIRIGYLLIFRYEGNSAFSVYIYNLSHSEINYHSTGLMDSAHNHFKRARLFEDLEDEDVEVVHPSSLYPLQHPETTAHANKGHTSSAIQSFSAEPPVKGDFLFIFLVIILVTGPGILNQTCWTEPKFLVSFDDFGFLRKNYNQTIPITPT